MRTRGARLAILVVVLGFSTGISWGQEMALAYLQPAMLPAAPQPSGLIAAPLSQGSEQHKFWDRENTLLFAGVAAMSAADFAITRANLQNGGRELNPVTRVFSGSTAGLAFNFAGQTAGVVGLSYFFHQTGHHKLERATSMVSIANSGFAVSYDLSHR